MSTYFLATDIIDNAFSDASPSSTEPAILDDSPEFCPLAEAPTLESDLRRTNQIWQHIPLDINTVPIGGSPLALMSDNDIMSVPPALVVHINQTAANGGLQVIAPQQVPFGDTMQRTSEALLRRDMHVTGSIASRNVTWPTVIGTVPAHLFPGIPIDGGPHAIAVRTRTRTTPLAPPSEAISNPIVKAFVLARALVDLQSRDDVNGDPHAVAEVMARSWGISAAAIMDLADVSLAPMGSLLRYAARADQVLPRVYGPLNELLCISTATQAAGRLVYGEHSAIDWRRARVLSEAVFYLNARVEGFTMIELSGEAKPGNPAGAPNRKGVIQMRPRPGVVWSCDPASFRLHPISPAEDNGDHDIPEMVTAALLKYDMESAPVRIAAAHLATISFAQSIVANPATETSESVIRGYLTATSSSAAVALRGRNAHALIRNLVYTALSGANVGERVKIREVLSELRPASQLLSVTVNTSVYVSLARRFTATCSAIRAAIQLEATARGAANGLTDWWDDFSAQLPSEIRILGECTSGWGAGTMWFMANPPNTKWQNLMGALTHNQIATAAFTWVASRSLPRIKASHARVLAAARAKCDFSARLFAARYGAMSDLADLLADGAKSRGRKAVTARIRVAGALWTVRAAAIRNAELAVATTSSDDIIWVQGQAYQIVTDTARAMEGLKNRMRSDKSIPATVRSATKQASTLSGLFSGVATLADDAQLYAPSRLFRYYATPQALQSVIMLDKAALIADVMRTVTAYENECTEPSESGAQPTAFATDTLGMGDILRAMNAPAATTGLTWWDVLATMDEDWEDYETRVSTLPADVQDRIMSAMYVDADALRASVDAAIETAHTMLAAAMDTVR